MGATVQCAKRVLANQFGGINTGLTPATYYLGVSTTAINKDGSGITEPPIGTSGYARVAVQNNDTNFGLLGTAGIAKVQNSVELSFPMFTTNLAVVGSTGTIRATHWFLSTSATSTGAADVSWYGELAKSRPLEADMVLSFPIGSLNLEVEMPAT